MPVRTWIIVSIAVLFLFLVPGINHGLWMPDEPRVAGTCAEIARTHDFVVPSLNGQPFLEKPPFYYAFGGIAGLFFGEKNDVPYRAVSLMFGILTILITFSMVSRKHGPMMGIIAGGMLASTWEIFMLSRWIQVDIALVFGVTLAMYAYQRWLDNFSVLDSIILGLGTGIAFMSKGLVGPAIIAAAILTDIIRQRDIKIVWKIKPFLVVAFMLISVLPWIIALWNRGGWPFLRVAIVVNNLMRFTGAPEGAALGHQNGIFYYFERFPGGLIPWTLIFIPALVSSIRNFREDRYVSWFIGPFILLSCASTKRGIYLAPLYPAVVCMTATWLENARRAKWEDILVKVTWALVIAGCIAPFAGLFLGLPITGTIMGLLSVCSLVLIMRGLKRREAISLVTAASIAMIAGSTVYYQYIKPEKDYLEFSQKAVVAAGGRDITLIAPREILLGVVSLAAGKVNSVVDSPEGINHEGIFIWEDKDDKILNALNQRYRVDILLEKNMGHKEVVLFKKKIGHKSNESIRLAHIMSDASKKEELEKQREIMNKENHVRWALFFSVTILCFGLGHPTLWDPDECRYAEIAREILVLHDWGTPHLNFLLYFEKPMMFMWLEAISFKLFGISESSAHIVPLLTGLGGAALIGLMAWKLWGRRAGLIAPLILLTSFEYFLLTCAVDINMPLTLFITAAMVFFWFGQSENKTGYFLMAWGFMALAALTKGPIGIMLPMGAVFIFIILTRQFSLIWESKPISGTLLFLAITLPWYILVCIRNPDFFSFFFINQNLQRFAVSNEHNQPFFYFFLVIIGGALPWTFLLPAAIKELWHKTMPREILYILVWFSLIFFFFMPSKSKLATYVLPCFPPLALIFAYAFRDSPKKGGWPLYAAGALWACLGISSMVFVVLASHGILNISSTNGIPLLRIGPVIGSIILAGAIIGIWIGRKHDTVAGLSVMAMSLMITVIVFAPQWDSIRSTKYLVKDLPASARLFAYGDYYQSSNFYTERPVGLVECKGELAFGIDHNKATKIMFSLDELVTLMNTDKNVYCLTKLNNVIFIKNRIPNLKVVRHSDKLCLLNVPRN